MLVGLANTTSEFYFKNISFKKIEFDAYYTKKKTGIIGAGRNVACPTNVGCISARARKAPIATLENITGLNRTIPCMGIFGGMMGTVKYLDDTGKTYTEKSNKAYYDTTCSK